MCHYKKYDYKGWAGYNNNNNCGIIYKTKKGGKELQDSIRKIIKNILNN